MWTKPNKAATSDTTTSAFANAAEAFVKHIEAVDGIERGSFVRGCVVLIARLLIEAVDLPETDGANEVEFVTSERHEEIIGLLKAKLGADDFYKTMLDPYEIASEPAVGCLSDDLGDLWRNIKNGSDALNQGYGEKAVGHWRVSFEGQWGEIATQALRPLTSLLLRQAS